MGGALLLQIVDVLAGTVSSVGSSIRCTELPKIEPDFAMP